MSGNLPVVRTNSTGHVIWQGRANDNNQHEEYVAAPPSYDQDPSHLSPTSITPSHTNNVEVREAPRESLDGYHRHMAFGEPLAVKSYKRGEDGEIYEEESDREEDYEEEDQQEAAHDEKQGDAPLEMTQIPSSLERTKSFATVHSVRSNRSRGSRHKAGRGGIDPRADDFEFTAWLKHDKQKYGDNGFVVPDVVLTYKDLAVYGDPVVLPSIQTVGSAALGMVNPIPFIRRKLGHAPEPQPKQILFPMSGYCKPGELTLVLGRPGAGCSTLLRTLGNVSDGLSAIKGDIKFNDIDRATFKRDYSSYLAYNPEYDSHFATLTVRQTLRFALECRMGGAIDQRRADRIEDFIEVCLRVFGLQSCADTKVGDEIVRGCSGGEKKRVSIAEQLCVAASVGFWDGSTRGLDSSSALDFVRAMRVMTDITQNSNTLSLYQASQEIYDIFDNVIVLAEGRCIYFGPTNEAKAYFEGLGFFCPQRKVTPDFLTGITEKYERIIREGWEGRVPNTIIEFEQAYLASQVHARMEANREALTKDASLGRRGSVFGRQVLANKTALGRQDLLKTQYTTSTTQQIKSLFKREALIQKGNVVLIGRVVSDTIMAIIIGSAFFQLEPNIPGAFSRGGVLFFALLYSCFGALASVPTVIQGRAVAAKHKSYKLFRAELQAIVMQAVDVPVSIFIIIVWSCINYWMVGLKPEAGAFFSYMIYLLAANQAFGGMVRIVASLSRSLEVANQINSVFLLVWILYTGYIIPYPSMKPVLKYIFWLNPLAYGLRAVLENEFDGLKIQCEGLLIPPYPNVPVANKACAIKGAVPGQNYVDGMAYLGEAFGYNTYNRWFNVLILMGFWVIIIGGMMAASKYVDYSPRAYQLTMWKKRRNGQTASKHSTMVADEEKAGEGGLVGSGNASVKSGAPKEKIIQAEPFTWKHINYTVPTKDGPKQLLHDVSGYVRPGELTALMGSSGAGKTTLIDAITQRKTIGTLEGQIYVGKYPQNDRFKRMTAYCEQMDVHNPNSTVREALQFSALLRQDESIPIPEKYAFVEKVLELLELDGLADATIGEPASGVGLSMEQRKRVTIGVELVSKPKILYLDEPTSGLDSQASFHLIKILRNLADSGQAILCTIHQPSAVLFDQFDSLLLLARGGRVVYFGELGADCVAIRSHFESHGAPPCPPTANVAEYMLDVIGAGTATRKEKVRDWAELWKEGDRHAATMRGVDEIRGCGDDQAVDVKSTAATGKKNKDGSKAQAEFSVPFSRQLPAVWSRMLITYYRNPEYNFSRILSHTACAFCIGFTFFQLSNSVTDMQNKVFSIFMAMIIALLTLNAVQPNYFAQRSWFTRESSAGFYDWKAFALSIFTVELPFAALASTAFFIVYYYLVGLNMDSARAFYFWLSYTMLNFFGVSLGLMVAAACPQLTLAMVINPFFMSMQILFCGVTITFAAMPKFWRSWLYHINPVRYFVEGVLANELGNNIPVTCQDNEVTRIIPPAGQACDTYFSPFFSQGGPGQLRIPTATDVCEYCQFKVGDEFVASLGWDWEHRWRNYGIVAGFWVFNIVLVGVLVRTYRTGR
ncbi:ABC-2 type transporter-domain-containing protein [Phlyctochytrium arcticum]|nr:ABC-2 type transporter-domain-containing protein [Phlyctochytrium arcticum]